jgi:hypothetical protein
MGVSWVEMAGERVKLWQAKGTRLQAISSGSTRDGKIDA